jgi:hypothetical protein
VENGKGTNVPPNVNRNRKPLPAADLKNRLPRENRRKSVRKQQKLKRNRRPRPPKQHLTRLVAKSRSGKAAPPAVVADAAVGGDVHLHRKKVWKPRMATQLSSPQLPKPQSQRKSGPTAN